MGSSSTVGTSSTFLSNTRERASNFGTCRLLVSSAPPVNTGDVPDTLDHTTGKSSGALWEVHTHVGVQHHADPLLQTQSLELKDPLTSCTFRRCSPNGTELTALHSKWMVDGSRGLRELCVDAQTVQAAHAPYRSKYFLTQHLKFLHLLPSNG